MENLYVPNIPELLDRCKNDILQNLGLLNDIPKELADTIANLYFNYHYLLTASLSVSAEELGYDLEKLNQLYIDTNLARMDVESASEAIKELRNVKDNRLYKYLTVLMLDIYKYKIYYSI